MNRHALCDDDVRRSKTHWLGALLTHKWYYEISEPVMGYLSASNLAALHAALRIKPSESARRHYLHPLRDVDPTMQIFQSWFRDDCQMLMIGPDALLLKERIQNPEAYYQHYHPRKPPQLGAWLWVYLQHPNHTICDAPNGWIASNGGGIPTETS